MNLKILSKERFGRFLSRKNKIRHRADKQIKQILTVSEIPGFSTLPEIPQKLPSNLNMSLL
jgi:hypothetical protein